jgi:hypothetical protein
VAFPTELRIAARVAMVGIDVVLESFGTLGREGLRELAQRPKAAHVPVPDVLLAAMVSVVDAVLEFQSLPSSFSTWPRCPKLAAMPAVVARRCAAQ